MNNTNIKRSIRGTTNSHLATYDRYDIDVSYPTEKDWRTDYPDQPVKNQYTCGSCYAHTATYAHEYAYRITMTPDATYSSADDYLEFSVQ